MRRGIHKTTHFPRPSQYAFSSFPVHFAVCPGTHHRLSRYAFSSVPVQNSVRPGTHNKEAGETGEQEVSRETKSIQE